MNELKPCPFCGVAPAMFTNKPPWFYVSCIGPTCWLHIETNLFKTRELAAEAWNTRTPQAEEEK